MLVKDEEGSGPRVLLKGGPGNWGRSACGTTHVARLEFPRPQGGMGSYPSVSIRWTEGQGHLYKSPEFAKSLMRLEDGEQAARCD